MDRAKYYFLGMFILAILIAGFSGSTGFLAGRLASDSTDIRRFAVGLLVEKGEAAGPEMMKIATDENAPREARRLAIFIMGEIPFEHGEKELMRLAESGPSELRGQAAFSLRKFKSKDSLDKLMALYGNENSGKGLRARALMALSTRSEPEAKSVLMEAAESRDQYFADIARTGLEQRPATEGN